MLKKKAFTLIELMVVIVIIGILATVIGLSVASQTKKARQAAFLESMNSALRAAELCLAEDGGTLRPYTGWTGSSTTGAQGNFICAATGTVVPDAKWPNQNQLNGYTPSVFSTSVTAVNWTGGLTYATGNLAVICTSSSCNKND